MKIVFNCVEFEFRIEGVSSSCQESNSFPYAIFDGLFDGVVLDQINQEIEGNIFQKDGRAIDSIEVKVWSDFEALPPATRAVF